MCGLALHPVKPVSARPQQVSLFLAQPEHLEQGPEKTESASKAKIHQAIDGRHLKKCNRNDLLINAAWSSAEVKNRWSYNFCPLVPLWRACGHLYLFIYNILKSVSRSSSNEYRYSHRIRMSNLALFNRDPVTKIGSLE